jgi:uncharacterized protein (DUF4213/DUF364 family)
MAPGSVIEETLARVAEVSGRELDSIEIERAVFGLFFTGVKLSDGSAGVCVTPKTIPEAVCCPSSVHEMPMPGKIRGRRVSEVLGEARRDHGLRRTLAIAAMNALADAAWDRAPRPGCTLHTGVDAFDLARIAPGDHVVVVGAFGPFLKELRRRKQSFHVLEQDARTLKPEELPFFRPSEDAPDVVPRADVLFVTGTTLVNDSIDELLALARPGAEIVVVGPTVGLVPDALFERGVRVAGGIRVTDPDALLDVLSEGGSGYHFFGRSAEKVALVRDDSHP